MIRYIRKLFGMEKPQPENQKRYRPSPSHARTTSVADRPTTRRDTSNDDIISPLHPLNPLNPLSPIWDDSSTRHASPPRNHDFGGGHDYGGSSSYDSGGSSGDSGGGGCGISADPYYDIPQRKLAL